MSDLIPRDEALRVLMEREVNCRTAQERLPQNSTATRRKASENLGATAAAFALAHRLVAAIPAIGTCATCAEWREHSIPVLGTCKAPVALGPYPMTPPTHFCAAWRPRP